MSTSSIGELLRAFLLADTTVANLVGTHMYPLRLPQKPTLPALVYQRISGERIGQLKGLRQPPSHAIRSMRGPIRIRAGSPEP